MDPAPNEPLDAVRAALARVDGLEPLTCDGMGHPIEDTQACIHVRCTLQSPQREELLAEVGPVVRRAGWVMAALVARRDLYALSWRPTRRDADVTEAAAKLAMLLSGPRSGPGDVPDRRGR